MTAGTKKQSVAYQKPQRGWQAPSKMNIENRRSSVAGKDDSGSCSGPAQTFSPIAHYWAALTQASAGPCTYHTHSLPGVWGVLFLLPAPPTISPSSPG